MLQPAAMVHQTAVVRRHVTERRLPPRRVWGMLALRSVVSLSLLLAVALAYALLGRPDPVAASFFSMRLDWRFDLWLAVKLLPFALWTGFVVDRRPTALPYLMVLHALIDASLPVLLLMVARGMALG